MNADDKFVRWIPLVVPLLALFLLLVVLLPAAQATALRAPECWSSLETSPLSVTTS